MSRRFGMLLVLGLVVGVMLAGSRARPAEGFKVWVHDEIIDEALKDVTNDATRAEIKGYFVRGPGWSGSAGQDIQQWDARLHFDSVRNPTELCQQWKQGFEAALIQSVKYSVIAARYQANYLPGFANYPQSALDFFG